MMTKLGRPFLKAAIKNSLFLNPESTALPVNPSTTELAQICHQAAIASQSEAVPMKNNLHHQLSKYNFSFPLLPAPCPLLLRSQRVGE
ncbi:hypothetical protein [Calothrix rhizosoleniae]|uniref:hypothetical protein n=1 Tax=Calothrix rhizosoleniae TaxID=888997 RepID=UPI00117865E6|nr:hypothetical protein [Calothrix rhizosoleniae]